MAVAFRGKTTAVWGTYGSVNITLPAGTQAGDLLILHMQTNQGGDSGWTAPSGSTLIVKEATGGQYQFACWKIATATDITNGYYTFDFKGATVYYCLLAFSGTHQTTPISAYDTGTGSISETSGTLDSAVTPAANCMFAYFAKLANDNTFTTCSMATSDPTFSLDFTANNTAGADTTYGVWHSGVRSASTATGNVTVGVGTSSTDGLTGLLVAIAPGSSAYSMAGALGTFTLSGIASTLKRGIKIIATVGTFALTSISTVLKIGIKMTTVVGTFIFTGYNAVFGYGKRLVASLGEFTLTGINATITSTRKIIMDLGTFTLTGINSILRIGYILVASVGEFVLTGYDAVINSVRTMVASLGEFTLTGINVTFPRASKVFANTGEFILTGINVAFSAGRKIVAALGTFTLTGVTALFPRASKVFATLGTFTLTGFSVRGLINGISILWTAASKSAISTMANISKNSATSQNIQKNISTWINKLKS